MIEDTVKLTGGIVKTQELDHNIAIIFDYIEDETSTIEAAITDNFVETNHSVQDHIAIKPKIYRLRGCVGEVVYQNQFIWIENINNKIAQNTVLQKTIDALKPIPVISGIVSNYTQAAINIVNQLESSYNRYRKMFDNFKNVNEFRNVRQKKVVAYLNQLLQQRIPVEIESLKFDSTFEEGQYHHLFYLQSVSAHQGNNDFISDIEITVKEIRMATTKVVDLNKNKLGTITASMIQKQPEVNEGVANGEEVNKTHGDQIKEAIKQATQDKPWLYNVCKTVGTYIENYGKSLMSQSGQIEWK